jgi:hypothetical protein
MDQVPQEKMRLLSGIGRFNTPMFLVLLIILQENSHFAQARLIYLIHGPTMVIHTLTLPPVLDMVFLCLIHQITMYKKINIKINIKIINIYIYELVWYLYGRKFELKIILIGF